LHGFVQNRAGDVLIEVQGEGPLLDRFQAELTSRPPPLARIDLIQWQPLPTRLEANFRIEASDAAPAQPLFIPADLATCEQCLAELFDPADRRYRYPFLNCTNCGPRLTILQAMPYDRRRTTMAQFAMCPACAAEYSDPANRRFHAQPTCCPACGPRLVLYDRHGRAVPSNDPLASTVEALRIGKIVAIKGLGGYHLACSAIDEQAVQELRRRKGREEKPFALMVPDLRAAERLCQISDDERRLLVAPQRPIVLLRRLPDCAVALAVAPGNPLLGVMLPYTPLHHLLLHDLGEVPLVMTSGNRSEEPIAFEDEDARQRLAGIADFVLGHDRPIHLRCDDSVTRCTAGAELPLRRSRGHAPLPVRLPYACPKTMLALGGQLKVTFALGQDNLALLSHHIGDLEYYEAYRAYEQAIAHYERLFAATPQVIVHDLHPEYASSRYAQQRGERSGLPLLGVQHHHAHLASCMADNGLEGLVIGVLFDGTGYGTDGAVWGGEFFIGDYCRYRRLAHLRYVPLPGGDQAIREPWRMAVAHLLDAANREGKPPAETTPSGAQRLDGSLALPNAISAWLRDVAGAALAIVQRQCERRLHAPWTSSVGRLFDAVAALAGVRSRVSYEGQAAMELEWLAAQADPDGCYPFDLVRQEEEALWLVDTRPLIAAVCADKQAACKPARIARRFHTTVVEIIVQTCRQLRAQTGLDRVVLSGGVFMNALLLTETIRELSTAGFAVYRHRQVPPNDAGLCLGQLAIAAACGLRDNQCLHPRGVADVPGYPR